MAESITLRNAWDDEPLSGGGAPEDEVEITLDKGNAASFGFTVGINELSREVQVTKVSSAPAFGRLLRDDCVVSIDKIPMRGLSHDQVVSCIKGRSRITLVVRRLPAQSRSERQYGVGTRASSISRPQSSYGGTSPAAQPQRSSRAVSMYDQTDGDVIAPTPPESVPRRSLTPESYSSLRTASGRRSEATRHRVLPAVPSQKVQTFHFMPPCP